MSYENRPDIFLITSNGIQVHIKTPYPIIAIEKNLKNDIYALSKNGVLYFLDKKRLIETEILHPVLPYENEGFRIYKDTKQRVWSYAANNKYIYCHDGLKKSDSIAVPRYTLWSSWSIGAKGGIYSAQENGDILKLENGVWKMYFPNSEMRGFNHSVREDEHQNLWISSYDGLYKVSPKQYTSVVASKTAYYFTCNNNNKYILCNDSFIYSIPNAFHYYEILKKEKLKSVYISYNKNVWYCTEGNIYELTPGKSIKRIPVETIKGSPNISFQFQKILEDRKGGIWISGDHGVFELKNETLKCYSNSDGLEDEIINSICIDREGRLYISGNSIYAFEDNKFRNISSQLNLMKDATWLTKDNNGAIWAYQNTNKIIKIGIKASGKYFIAETVVPTHLNTPVMASSVTFDKENNLWLTDNQNLFCHPYLNGHYPDQDKPRFWDENIIGNPMLYSDDNGNIYLVSKEIEHDYLRTIKGTALLHNNNVDIPRLHLTNLLLDKRPYKWKENGFKTDKLGIPENLILNHSQNFLHFSFIGLSKNYSEYIGYRYKLEGYDKNWSPTSVTNEAEYTGLPSGNYTFYVQACNANGDWSQPLSYQFKILPVWYRTWWATCIWALLGILLLFLIFQVRIKAIKRKSQLQKLVVVEQLKALRAQINPYFIQNTFEFLSHQIDHVSKDKAIESMHRVSSYLRNVLYRSNESVVTLEDEITFNEEYLEMQQAMLNQVFKYEVNVSDEVDTFDIIVPSMLLQPIVENALKYGIDYSTTQNFITINVACDNNYVSCVISDSGNKRAPSNAGKNHLSHGMKLTEDRLHLLFNETKLKSRISWELNTNNGRDVIIQLPMK